MFKHTAADRPAPIALVGPPSPLALREAAQNALMAIGADRLTAMRAVAWTVEQAGTSTRPR